jgi:type I restriction enzyme S subunit
MSLFEIEFRDFVTLQRGFDLPIPKMKEGEVPVLGSNCIVGYHNEVKVEPPGVVTGRSGTLGIVQYTDKPFWPHNTSLWVKDFKGNFPKFVYYKLQTLKLERFNGGASVPTLNRNVLAHL